MLNGGFGRKLNSSQIKLFKLEWLKRVQGRKKEADYTASIKTVVESLPIQEYVDYKGQNKLDILVKYLNNIVVIHKAQQVIANTKWEADTTLAMKQRSYHMIDFYEEVLRELATFYPPNHFTVSPSRYFSELTSSRYSLHWLISEPYGAGTGGTIVGVTSAASVKHDLKLLVESIGWSLIYRFQLEGVNPKWSEQWLETE
ncbi:hypothetical protein R1T15_17410 [Mucilaginibacter sp. L3T2-6]|nr:hypothetical protein [Mucilaginibacter sp. L3T2-6]MDV6216298.1 hypothetical protein [Mucilaginibacter sp. L3T2-6]